MSGVIPSVWFDIEKIWEEVKTRLQTGIDFVKGIKPEQIDELEDKVARRSEGLGIPGKSRVSDRVGDLFFSIDGTNAAPTSGQRKYFAEIEPEFRERMAEINKFISETIPQWNEKLKGWNAPTLTTRKPVDF